jgi:hypothetical protein
VLHPFVSEMPRDMPDFVGQESNDTDVDPTGDGGRKLTQTGLVRGSYQRDASPRTCNRLRSPAGSHVVLPYFVQNLLCCLAIHAQSVREKR